MYNVSIKKSKYTEKDLWDNLKSVWDSVGRQPYFKDMSIGSIHVGTYIHRFGSWNNALLEFAKHLGQETTLIKKEIKKTKRKTIGLSLRYDILKRDNFKCVLCGDSPAKNNKCELEIDHIVPISKGGLNELLNLRTLCLKCNQGKKNKD